MVSAVSDRYSVSADTKNGVSELVSEMKLWYRCIPKLKYPLFTCNKIKPSMVLKALILHIPVPYKLMGYCTYHAPFWSDNTLSATCILHYLHALGNKLLSGVSHQSSAWGILSSFARLLPILIDTDLPLYWSRLALISKIANNQTQTHKCICRIF